MLFSPSEHLGSEHLELASIIPFLTITITTATTPYRSLISDPREPYPRTQSHLRLRCKPKAPRHPVAADRELGSHGLSEDQPRRRRRVHVSHEVVSADVLQVEHDLPRDVVPVRRQDALLLVDGDVAVCAVEVRARVVPEREGAGERRRGDAGVVPCCLVGVLLSGVLHLLSEPVALFNRVPFPCLSRDGRSEDLPAIPVESCSLRHAQLVIDQLPDGLQLDEVTRDPGIAERAEAVLQPREEYDLGTEGFHAATVFVELVAAVH